MKNVLKLVALLWLMVTAGAHAQSKTIEKVVAVPTSKNINLNLKFGNDIKITAWDKKDMSVKITYAINSGRLNDALLVKFNSDNEAAQVNIDLDNDLMQTGKEADCPDSSNRGFSTNSNGQQVFTCATINYEIFVPRNANLEVETINGNIEIRGLTGPVKAKSISGFVDMSWPDKKGAAVSLKTITGEVYSDFNINFSNKQEQIPMVGYQLKGDVNGSGSEINLESISNNIFLRKEK
ncbi:MAG: hypothetical protein COW65_10260 [Cytophagales bacterium CG18_big_fil_WC_8_21_14_2_50_42_9]|nr:MAG: hypothetical protein COW65_10260 [Cytophagales bacterium CG18_big_fil_WC_8_21_14_2_50_42_9]